MAEVDATSRLGLVVLAVTLTAAVAVELTVYRTPVRRVLGRLGFGRPGLRALVVARPQELSRTQPEG